MSGAAFAPRVEPGRAASSDPVPVAALVASLGEPSAGDVAFGAGGGTKLLLILFVIAVMSLVLETGSRRWDGKP